MLLIMGAKDQALGGAGRWGDHGRLAEDQTLGGGGGGTTAT